MKEENNWYIQYDFKTFNILDEPNFDNLIYTVAEMFKQVTGPSQKVYSQIQKIPEWIEVVAQAFTQISILLYNFFYVQKKLSNKEDVKNLFSKIQTVLRVQNEYAKYFYSMSKNYRVNRILALCLRLSSFIQSIFIGIEGINKSFDQTLLDNLNQVYLFMQQKISETLSITKMQGDHQLNIIMLDILSMLLRNNGDPTMYKILDKNTRNEILTRIQKQNEINSQFQGKKILQKQSFQANRYFSIEDGIQEDPSLKKEKSDSSFFDS